MREGSSDEWVSGRWQAADVLRALSMSSISASLADGITGAAVSRLDRRQWRRGERRGGCRRRCCWIRYAGWLRGLVVVEGGIGIGRLLLRCCLWIPSTASCSVASAPPPPRPNTDHGRGSPYRNPDSSHSATAVRDLKNPRLLCYYHRVTPDLVDRFLVICATLVQYCVFALTGDQGASTASCGRLWLCQHRGHSRMSRELSHFVYRTSSFPDLALFLR
jgi:hypothetical protein